MTDWMTCTTCKTVVKANETGTCLSCQGGFTGKLGKDAYLFTEPNDYYPEVEALKEKINAIEERLQQENCLGQHQDRDESGETQKTGGCNRPPNCS